MLLCGYSLQASTQPSASSAALTTARFIFLVWKLPQVIRTLQAPQPPLRQPTGMPWQHACSIAASTCTSSPQAKDSPVLSMETR
jgi:hypothetical protein